jgi:hypothetical protein
MYRVQRELEPQHQHPLIEHPPPVVSSPTATSLGAKPVQSVPLPSHQRAHHISWGVTAISFFQDAEFDSRTALSFCPSTTPATDVAGSTAILACTRRALTEETAIPALSLLDSRGVTTKKEEEEDVKLLGNWGSKVQTGLGQGRARARQR